MALNHSDVVLMNDAEPEVYNAYGATVVAWGGGPTDDNQVDMWAKRIQSDREKGVRHACSNAWMLTATAETLAKDPGLRQAICLDPFLDPIVPPWLWDFVYKEVPSYWGCTNNPRFREHLRNRIILAAMAGADGLHLDDHVGAAGTVQHGGCYCDFCVAGFRAYLKNVFSPMELREKGIDDIGSFNYLEFVRRFTSSRQGFVDALKQGEIPLSEEFQTFQLKAAAALVRELAYIFKKMRGDSVPVSANSFELQPSQIVDSEYLDYFVAEVHHHLQLIRHQAQSTSIETIREWKIPASLIFVYKLADALNKPLAATASGWDWAYVKEKKLTGLVKLWIALSYAFGHRLMVPHHQWCYTPEKGTHWYDGPTEEYAPLYQFVRRNKEFFDGYEAIAQVGVVYSNLAVRRNFRTVHDVCLGLTNANIPFGVIAAGDDWLNHTITRRELSKFEIVAVPEPSMLEGKQKRLIEAWKRDRRAISLKNEKDMLGHIEPIVSLRNASKVWALPRRIKQHDAPIVCHLVNWSYDITKDKMTPQKNIDLCLSSKLFDGQKIRKITLIDFHNESTSLQYEIIPNGVQVVIPEVHLWSILILSLT